MIKHDPYEKYPKVVIVEAPIFDGRLDPQYFIDWLSGMKKYLSWYNMSDPHKVKFEAMKLTRPAGHYWTNVELLKRLAGNLLVRTWDAMKLSLTEKYLPASYLTRLLDEWNQCTQDPSLWVIISLDSIHSWLAIAWSGVKPLGKSRTISIRVMLRSQSRFYLSRNLYPWGSICLGTVYWGFTIPHLIRN